MTLTASAHGGRVAALGLLAVLLALLWVGPVGAYRDVIDAGAARLEQRAALLERYRALLHEPTGGAGQPGLELPSVMLPEIAEPQATALLQERLKSAVTASKVQLRSIQVLRSENLSSAVRIGVRIRAAGDIATLARLLYAIEAARPVLYPDNLQIQAHAATPATAADPVEFQLDVAAFIPGGA